MYVAIGEVLARAWTSWYVVVIYRMGVVVLGASLGANIVAAGRS
jgi:hypothetical protein